MLWYLWNIDWNILFKFLISNNYLMKLFLIVNFKEVFFLEIYFLFVFWVFNNWMCIVFIGYLYVRILKYECNFYFVMVKLIFYSMFVILIVFFCRLERRMLVKVFLLWKRYDFFYFVSLLVYVSFLMLKLYYSKL